MRMAAPMCDIGEIGIPCRILSKPGRLTHEELDAVKKHTEIGAHIFEGSRVPALSMAKDIALLHHERWDGSGYPNGLVGAVIPESARIAAIADVYDALVHDRAYRPAMSEREAVSVMSREMAEHFDPTLFKCFLDLLPVFRHIREQVANEGQCDHAPEA